MLLLDANVILRYLLEDNEEMTEKAKEYIRRDDACVTAEVIEEVIYVLQKFYSIERSKISYLLTGILSLVNINNAEVIVLALQVFGNTNLDFVDCVLFAYHKLLGFEIATFDKQLIKLMSRTDAGEEF